MTFTRVVMALASAGGGGVTSHSTPSMRKRMRSARS